MPGHVDWPPTQRVAARILHVVMYICGAFAGMHVVLVPPRPTALWLPYETVLVVGFLVMVFGAVGSVASALMRWPVEWVAAWVLGGSMIAASSTITTSPATRSLIIGLAAGYLARAVELWVFSKRARNARIQRINMWRKVARDTTGD